MLDEELLPEDTAGKRSNSHRLYRARWYILFFFSLSNCNQCLAWFSFASAKPTTMQAYFGKRASKATLDLLLNWGPFIAIPCFPMSVWLMQQRGGLRRAIMLGILLCFAGNMIRCIPIAVSAASGDSTFRRSAFAFGLYHAGQIFIAAAGPLQMGATTRLASVWFGERERTTATAIATTANALGTTIGFLNPLWLATSDERVGNIFWFCLGLQAVAVVCALVHFPVAPATPPSAAAAAGDGEAAVVSAAAAGSGGGWLSAVRRVGGSRSFVALGLAASVMTGVTIGWQSLFYSFLGPTGLSQRAVSWIGFGNGLAANVAEVASGVLIDTLFRRQLKKGILLGVLGAFLCTAWFLLQLQPAGGGHINGAEQAAHGLPSAGAPSAAHLLSGSIGAPRAAAHGQPLLPRSEASLVLAVTLAGFFQGITSPLFYELSAELTYPVKEGTSAGVLVLLLNVSAAVLIQLNTVLAAGAMNAIMLGTLGGVLLLVGLGVREEYRRPRDDAGAEPEVAGGHAGDGGPAAAASTSAAQSAGHDRQPPATAQI